MTAFDFLYLGDPTITKKKENKDLNFALLIGLMKVLSNSVLVSCKYLNKYNQTVKLNQLTFSLSCRVILLQMYDILLVTEVKVILVYAYERVTLNQCNRKK